MKEKILVTGAGGYIGSVAVYNFLQNGLEVVGIDNFSTGFRKPLAILQEKFGQDRLRYYRKDLRDDLSSVFAGEEGIVAAVHFAAHCFIDESMKNPQKYFSNNIGGSQNLLAHLLDYGIKNVVFSSTCAVYGEAEYVPVNECHPTNPQNPYGASKKMVEQIMEWYGKQVGLNYVSLRYFNVCGASDDGLMGDSKRPSVLLVQNAVRGALGIAPFSLTCPQVDTPDRTPIRDYINVVDLANAHLKAISYLISGGESETINLGTETGNSVLEVISKVRAVTGVNFAVGKTTAREGEYAKMVASVEKAAKILGWKPEKTIIDSINSLMKWYQKHPQGWED